MSILTVGSGEQFATLSAAVVTSQDGDVIQVQAGTYTNDFSTINTKITIEGVGGMVHLLATQSPPDGKAILTTNTDVTLDNIELSGAQVPDGNGAGIRYQGGNLTLNNCYVHDNQEGLLSGSTGGTGSITIENSEFANNGAGDGLTHDIYVGDIGSLTIDGSYIHGAVVGHEVKSRAQQTTITNSRIEDGPTGTASYSIDLPNGGNALIQGDTIEQGPDSQNPAIIAYGEEGGVYANSSLTVTGDTILNDLSSPSASAVLNATTAPVTVTGNAIYGLSASQVVSGAATISGNTTLSTEPALVTTSPFATSATATPAAPQPVAATPATPTPVTVAPAAPIPVTPTPAAPASSVPTSSDPVAPSASGTAGQGVTQPDGSSASTQTTPAPLDTLVLHLSEDAWMGDAQFIVSVDGKQLGGAQSVTALHGQNSSENFTVTGQFGGAGPHDLAVTFLNDAWGGTPSTDRNLYVDGVELDGTRYPAATAALYTSSTVHLQIGVPTGS